MVFLSDPLFKIKENLLTAIFFITSVLTILLSVATFGDAYTFSVGDAFPLGRIVAGAICLVFTFRTVLGPITSQDIWQSTDRFDHSLQNLNGRFFTTTVSWDLSCTNPASRGSRVEIMLSASKKPSLTGCYIY